MSIRFEPLTRDDLPQLLSWLQKPHVAEWWRDLQTMEQVEADHLPALEGREPSYHYVIVVDDRPVGMIQTYLVSDYPEWEAIVQVGKDVAGVDSLIGDEDLIGQCLGPRILTEFVRDVITAPAVIATVEEPNRRSWRAFEKAGFRVAFDYEEEGRPHRLMRLEREPAKTA